MLRPIFIGITGGTGSGKSTVVKTIIENIPPSDIAMIEQDAYYKDQTNLPMEERIKADLDELKMHFRPEFLNRLDDIVIFEQLSLNAITNIVDILFNNIKKKVEEKDIKISLTQSAKEYIAKIGFDPVYGARPLKRAIYEIVEDKLADLILEDKIGEGSSIEFDVQNDEVFVNIA